MMKEAQSKMPTPFDPALDLTQTPLVEIRNLTEMKAFAHLIATFFRLHSKAARARLLLLLDGEMGAGKTQFTRFLVESLGNQETCSPSFAIHNQYELPNLPDLKIDHVDLYRLESEEEIESTGFWDLFTQKKALVLVEWADRLRALGLFPQLPSTWPRLTLRFEIQEAEKRLVHIQPQNLQNLAP